MTVQKLIDKLMKIENKDMEVIVYNQDTDMEFEILSTELVDAVTNEQEFNIVV